MADEKKIMKELSELVAGLRLLVGWQTQLLEEIQKLTQDLYSVLTTDDVSGGRK